MATDQDLIRRATAAYYRTPVVDGPLDQPGEVRVQEHAGKRYVVLANVNGILAVYRVRTVNGQDVLKGLKRYPAALEG